ncbi:MAG: HEPN domain-containing protein [Chloroflexota bacterium]|nr:HEPN domain-containing protein [Chloroflexota bacterium]
MAPRNPELHTAMLAYVPAAMQVLAVRIQAGARVIAIREEYWERQPGTDDFLRQERARPLWDTLYSPAIEELRSLREYGECAAAIERDPTVACQLGILVGVGGIQSTYLAELVMARTVIRILSDLGRPGFEEGPFDREYAALEQAFYEDSAPAEIVAPLTGFSIEAERIELDEDLAIVPLTEEDRARYAELGEFVTDTHASGVPRFAVRSDCRAPKLVGERTPEQEEKARAFVEEVWRFDARLRDLELVLGSYKTGRYEMRRRDVRIHSWFPTNPGLFYAQMLPQGYGLNEQEAADLPAFWREVQNAGIEHKKRGYLGVALRRLRYAAGRERMEDRLVDLVVAAEALFPGVVGKPSSAELSYRLAMYVAGFLGKDQEERRSIFERMREAYRLRSEIVHGVVVDEGRVAQVVTDVEGFVREGLKKAVGLAAASPGGSGKLAEEKDLTFPSEIG